MLGHGHLLCFKKKRPRRILKLTAALPAAAVLAMAASGANVPLHFLATNDDTVAPFPPNTVGLYAIAADGRLTNPARVSTGGNGMAGGYFGTSRILIAPRGSEAASTPPTRSPKPYPASMPARTNWPVPFTAPTAITSWLATASASRLAILISTPRSRVPATSEHSGSGRTARSSLSEISTPRV